MTKARKGEPKPDKKLKLKLKKESVKDLDPKAKGEGVKGGEPRECSLNATGC